MELYEAAAIATEPTGSSRSGTSRCPDQTTIITLLILRLGRMADVSLEQVLADPESGIRKCPRCSAPRLQLRHLKGLTSIGVAVDMFKSVINVVFVFTANYIVKKMGEESIL
jgi:putative aldouronate transport system permease protein